MNHGAAGITEHGRFIRSLAGAVLISAVGFGLAFLLVAWLTHWLIWSNDPPHSAIFPIAGLLAFLFSLSAIIRTGRKRRNDRKKGSDPKRAIRQ